MVRYIEACVLLWLKRNLHLCDLWVTLAVVLNLFLEYHVEMKGGHCWDGCNILKDLYTYAIDSGKTPKQAHTNCHKEGAAHVAMDDGIFTAGCMHSITYGYACIRSQMIPLTTVSDFRDSQILNIYVCLLSLPTTEHADFKNA